MANNVLKQREDQKAVQVAALLDHPGWPRVEAELASYREEAIQTLTDHEDPTARGMIRAIDQLVQRLRNLRATGAKIKT